MTRVVSGVKTRSRRMRQVIWRIVKWLNRESCERTRSVAAGMLVSVCLYGCASVYTLGIYASVHTCYAIFGLPFGCVRLCGFDDGCNANVNVNSEMALFILGTKVLKSTFKCTHTLHFAPHVYVRK